MTLHRTSLNQVHKQAGAQMVDFAGWEMPVHYGSALKEHLAVRQAAGIFDVSHMGQIELVGADALTLAQKITCNDISRLQDGQAQYSAFLYPTGTFVDDIVVYRINGEHLFICVNAANKDKDFEWVSSHLEGKVETLDSSAEYAQLAVQGPRALTVMKEIVPADLESLRYYWFLKCPLAGVEALISRTGYTGEDGFELYIPSQVAPEIWAQLCKAGKPLGLEPAGLAARNTLRLEVCYSLYGHEIDDTTNPWEAGLGWIVKMDKGQFIGQEALRASKESGLARKLVGFEMVDRGIARDHYPVFVDDKKVGQVSSGSYTPFLKRNLGLAYLPIDRAGTGQIFHIDVRGKRLRAKVIDTPFYKR